MRLFLLLTALIFISCGSDKIIELPEIKHSTITQVSDVSPAYLFYDETQPDSLELNRKNLISTTNWLVNVDKRLTLKQAIPQIQFLQNKKNSSSHKNKKAKNYYTCNNSSIKNLGFIDFTDISYHLKGSDKSESNSLANNETMLHVFVSTLQNIQLKTRQDSTQLTTTIDRLVLDLNQLPWQQKTILTLNLSEVLSIQDYITLKDQLTTLNKEGLSINNNEFIY